MSIRTCFAREIYYARTEKNLTQAQAAEMLSISVRWFQKIEKGEVLPSSELTIKIVATLEIDGKRLKERHYLNV